MVSGNSCCVPNCINSARSCNLSFFRCPKDTDRAAKWFQNARLAVDVHSTAYKPQGYRFCSDHFDRSAFMNDSRKSLTHFACPTIFNIPNPPYQVKDLKKQLSKPSMPTALEVAIKPEVKSEDFDNPDGFSGDNLIKLEFRSWLMITRDSLDFLSPEGWPIISMTVMANLETGQYIARVLNQTYKSGQFHNEEELENICLEFFNGNYPCMGQNSTNLHLEFPVNLLFSPFCQKLCFKGFKPKSLEGLMCDKCSLNDIHNHEDLMSVEECDEPFWPSNEAKHEQDQDKIDDNPIVERVQEFDEPFWPSNEVKHEQDQDKIDDNPIVERVKEFDEPFWPSNEVKHEQDQEKIDDNPIVERVLRPKKGNLRQKEGETTLPKTFPIEWDGKEMILDLQVDKVKKWNCPICSSKIKKSPRNHLKLHLLYNFKCGFCRKLHLCPFKLWDHLQDNHNDPGKWEVKCVLCSEILDIRESRNKYPDHLTVCKRKQNYIKFQQIPKRIKRRDPKVCDLCGKTFDFQGLLRKHIKAVHENKIVTWKCHLCSAEINAKRKPDHLRHRHLFSRFQCPVCYQRHRSARDFSSHVEENHPGQVEMYPCPECKINHLINPGEGPSFVDHHEKCLSDHLKQMKRKEKERSLAKPLKFECPHCPKKYQSQTLLNAHLRDHKESGHFCTQCTYRTHRADLLKGHIIRVHSPKSEANQELVEPSKTSERDRQCSVCDTLFHSSSDLEHHKQTNHVNQSLGFQCRECFQIFKLEKNLESHQSLVHNVI